MNTLYTENFQAVRNQHDLTHWHEKVEIIRVIENEMICVVNGIEYHLQKDDICIINRLQLHRIYCDPNQDCTFQRLMIDTNLFSSDQVIYDKYVVPMLSDRTFTHIQGKHGNKFTSEVENLMDEIADIERLKPIGYEFHVIALIFMLCQRFYQYYELFKGKTKAMVNPDILLYRRISDFIARNYAEKLTLEEIAASVNISRSKCCALFRDYAGLTPINFLNLYRLKMSADMLKDTTESITSISISCGFGQPSYYNRLFLKKYKMTPKEYRERMRKDNSL